LRRKRKFSLTNYFVSTILYSKFKIQNSISPPCPPISHGLQGRGGRIWREEPYYEEIGG
jgi:hypothetical protein